MESMTTLGFYEMTKDELFDVDAGGPWGPAIALVALLCKVAKDSFEAGRAFARDCIEYGRSR